MAKNAMLVSTKAQVTIVQIYGNYASPSETLKMFAALNITRSLPMIKDNSDMTIEM